MREKINVMIYNDHKVYSFYITIISQMLNAAYHTDENELVKILISMLTNKKMQVGKLTSRAGTGTSKLFSCLTDTFIKDKKHCAAPINSSPVFAMTKS